MATSTTRTNKPILPRGNDQSPLKYNRAALYSGKALDFDGVNDSISVPYSDTLGGVWTWVSIIEADALSGYQELFGGMYSVSNATIYLKEDQLTIYTNQDNLNTAFNFETGKKYHVACSQSGDTISVYVNGQAAGSVSLTIPLNSTSGTYIIGKRPNQANEYFNGKMSGVKVFDVALTAAQVADLYNNPEKVVPTGVEDTALKLWLPMMEGAGTTAYDGSGNGNHGTISGATYVNGVGAPVAQSAVIDWNKGTNKIYDSEFFASSTATPNYFRGFIRNSKTEESPFGTFDAVKMTEDGTSSNPALVMSASDNNTNVHTLKVYLKADAPISIAFATNGSVNPGNINVTTEWQAFEVSQSSTSGLSIHIGGFATITQGSGVVLYVWHPQLQEASSAGPYVPTIGTSQPTPVLLPQGLTSGRDITGVNLFENVRKQGALNLDGNSWAEVHDNGSLDVTTGLTLEAWIYIEDNATQGRILNKWGGSGADRSYQIFMNNALVRFLIGDGTSQNGLNSATSLSVGNWYHIVGTYDSANIKIYIDGSEDVSVAETFTLVDSAETLYLGTYYNQTNTSVNPLAQPRIYNRALTAEEVERNYNAGKNIYK